MEKVGLKIRLKNGKFLDAARIPVTHRSTAAHDKRYQTHTNSNTCTSCTGSRIGCGSLALAGFPLTVVNSLAVTLVRTQLT